MRGWSPYHSSSSPLLRDVLLYILYHTLYAEGTQTILRKINQPTLIPNSCVVSPVKSELLHFYFVSFILLSACGT